MAAASRPISQQAATWYQRAADNGFAPAEYRLASMYEKGSGVERDLAKAKQYYQLAAAKGNASAMHNLAVLLASGAVGAQDYAAAPTGSPRPPISASRTASSIWPSSMRAATA